MKNLNITLSRGIYINPYETVPRATVDVNLYYVRKYTKKENGKCEI
jgi:hypothetical protein